MQPQDAPDAADPRPIRVLLVAQDAHITTRFRDVLLHGDARFAVSCVSSLEQALLALRDPAHDVALVDLDLPEAGGRDVLHRIRVASDVLPIIALVDRADGPLSLEALRLGAQDCLRRLESDTTLVVRLLQHAVERHRLVRALRESRAREHRNATHDALTDLPNRQAFVEGLGKAVASAQRRAGRLALLFCDLDGFKAVNDELGHEAGDALLAEVGRRLRRVTRRSDLVARLGGDEFVVALNDVESPRSVMRAAEQFHEAVCEPVAVLGQDRRVGLSVGVALYPDDARTPDALLRAADLAMYSAKQTPESRVCFYEPRMDREIGERFALVANVREATRRDEFFLEFQPQIDTARERWVGAEALLRWLHPTRGRLAPAAFLSIAEDTGMMREIGGWVLREACAAAAGWGLGANDPFVAVNVSTRQLLDARFADEVAAALDESPLPARRLVIEMTERGMVDAAGRVHAVLRRIAELGVSFAVDHFGAGAESFGVLQWEPVQMLKIDGSLLYRVGASERENRLLPALLAFAQQLGVTPVAEGVETVSQLHALRFLGCDRMQGFLFGAPMSGRELAAQQGDGAKPPWREVFERQELAAEREGPGR